MAKMRAMLLVRSAPIAERPLAAVELPIPRPAADEVLVRVHVCGVCRTDLHVITGDLPPARRPLVPGHMVVGVVAERGPDVRDVQVGARVGFGWLRGTCGAATIACPGV